MSKESIVLAAIIILIVVVIALLVMWPNLQLQLNIPTDLTLSENDDVVISASVSNKGSIVGPSIIAPRVCFSAKQSQNLSCTSNDGNCSHPVCYVVNDYQVSPNHEFKFKVLNVDNFQIEITSAGYLGPVVVSINKKTLECLKYDPANNKRIRCTVDA